MAFGRPSVYKPEYCSKLIEHMSKGLSFDCFCATIDVSRDTIYEWARVHEDFSYAKKEAFAKNLLFWENLGMQGMWQDKEGPQFNTTNFVFQMKNRHKWVNQHTVEVTNSAAPQVEDIFSIPEKEK